MLNEITTSFFYLFQITLVAFLDNFDVNHYLVPGGRVQELLLVSVLEQDFSGNLSTDAFSGSDHLQHELQEQIPVLQDRKGQTVLVFRLYFGSLLFEES